MSNKNPSLTEIFFSEKSFFGLYLKTMKLYDMYKKPEKYFEEYELDEQVKGELKGNIKIWITASVVQFAEIFGIYLLCFHQRRKELHKKILDYQVSEVNDFYKNIEKRRIPYFRKILGYPSFNQISNRDASIKLNESSKNFKQKLIKISKFYLKYKLLYNSYKHGLRTFPMFDEKYSSGIMVINRDKKSFTIYNVDIDEAIEFLKWMMPVLNNTLKVFEERVFHGKMSFKAHIY